MRPLGTIKNVDITTGSFTMCKKQFSTTQNILKNCFHLAAGQTYYLYAQSQSSVKFIYLYGSNKRWNFGEPHLITQSELNGAFDLYGTDGKEVRISTMWVTTTEQSQPIEDYKPYVVPQTVTTPCDLYEGDIWYPMSGKVVRTKWGKFDKRFDNVHLGGYMYPFEDRQMIATGYRNFVPNSKEYTPNILCNTFKAFHRKKMENLQIFECSVQSVTTYFCFPPNTFNPSGVTPSGYVPDFHEMFEWFNARYDEGNPVVILLELESPIIEQYPPQPIFAPQGTVNVLSAPTDLTPDLSATMLTRRI